MSHSKRLILLFCSILSFAAAALLFPGAEGESSVTAPATLPPAQPSSEDLVPPCRNKKRAAWRDEQVIEDVPISASPACEPDNPNAVTAFVKGTDRVAMETLMRTRLARDTLIKGDDRDGDGDPDVIRIVLEVIELNGSTPDGDYLFPTYAIAPGIQPGLWVFAPKTRGMAVKHAFTDEANEMLRAPSPVIRVEQGDTVMITLENTHYFPHSIHLHGVDHPWRDAAGHYNDGVPQTGERRVLPGERKTYTITPRQPGTMFYHCHVQTDTHLMMGLNGMFVVEENRPDNWLQTFNVGAGHVRHSSAAVKERYDREYDLHYQALDKELGAIIQSANDPRLIAKAMNREYDLTDATEDYYLLNGHAFPYTLRDALIVAKPDENVKLRVVNAQHGLLALHFHGHKATVTALDGVEQPPGLQVTRDVFDLAPAQRLDLHLQTSDDGLHGYGPGIWLFHDHVESGITTNGMNPGGNISALVYEEFLSEQGMPAVAASIVQPLFSKRFQAGQAPVWQQGEAARLYGDVAPLFPSTGRVIAAGLLVGIGFCLLVIVFRSFSRSR